MVFAIVCLLCFRVFVLFACTCAFACSSRARQTACVSCSRQASSSANILSESSSRKLTNCRRETRCSLYMGVYTPEHSLEDNTGQKSQETQYNLNSATFFVHCIWGRRPDGIAINEALKIMMMCKMFINNRKSQNPPSL